jgi:DnaJ-class molecular chaperone
VRLIHKIDAAIKLGISMELLESFISRCPKPHENVKLQTHKMAKGEILIDEDELLRFQNYLNNPWPLPPKGTRPNIPKAIIDDIKAESSYACAICGDMNNGEIAHIEAVADTYNNSPDNLIYLCPNHHTQYDKGFKIKNNLTVDEVRAAKRMKRLTRRRMMRYEQNATKTLSQIMTLIKDLHKQATSGSETFSQAALTEADILLKQLPEYMKNAEEQARKDQPVDKIDQAVLKSTPTLSKMILGIEAQKDKARISQMVATIADKVNDILIDIDEVECPHCNGAGLTGLVGDFCSYCRGTCYVSKKQADDYDPELLDEKDCPHCGGRGTTGLNGDLCCYCGGSCIVSEDKAEEYDPGELDEVECPRCNGKGTYGWNNDFCLFCHGSQTVSTERASEYDESVIDQQECPHCGGSGTIGWNSIACGYCHGSCLISSDKAYRYDPELIDQVDCPRCQGKGTIGWGSTACSYCGGDTVVTRSKLENFNTDSLNEVECPRCNGRGITGLNGDVCKLCHGDTIVSPEKREAYLEKYGR